MSGFLWHLGKVAAGVAMLAVFVLISMIVVLIQAGLEWLLRRRT